MRNDVVSLTGMYAKIVMKSWFQYKVDAVLRSVAVFLRESTGIIVIYFTLQKFNQLNGWNINEMLFLFSFLFLTYGIMILFFTGLRDFSYLVRSGNFDRFLLRPRGILYQLIFCDADWFAAMGHGGLGIVLFIFSANKVHISWNFYHVVYLIAAIIGGVLIQGAIFLVLATMNIYLLETNSIKELFYWNMRKFAGYPISIFSKYIQAIMIYVVPFAFVNYFPTQFFLRKSDGVHFPQYFMYLSPLVGIVLFALAYGFWKFSLIYYKSSGN